MNTVAKKATSIRVAGKSIPITNADKILFAQSGITKKMLVSYYAGVAHYMLPYTKDRPLTMQRFPEGIAHEGFYQKNKGAYFPHWIQSVAIKTQAGQAVDYIVANSQATLVYLANQGCITFHLWLSKINKLDYPDKIIFDLDPAGKASFSTVRTIAYALKELLDTLQLPSFPLLTGSRGIHIIIPLKRVHTFAITRSFAHDLAALLVMRYPRTATLEMHKSKRGNRIFIDWLRNGFGATAVAPYAVRAHEGAPVATPIGWQELPTIKTSQQFTIKTIKRRLRAKDPWHGYSKSSVTLTKARVLLKQLTHDEA